MSQTPLEKEIRRLIAGAGPMPVARYMALCLTHPQHGYYTTRDPLGAGGDFTTAPEVSQMFGELLGLWALSVWRMMGEPDRIRLIELGPGRGTMMRDALARRKSAAGIPIWRCRCIWSKSVRRLSERRSVSTLGDIELPISWHRQSAGCPGRSDNHPRQRVLGRAAGASGGEADRRLAPARDRAQRQRRFRARVLRPIRCRNSIASCRRRSRMRPSARSSNGATICTYWISAAAFAKNGAALIIDYGHTQSDVGETLQAVNEHAFADPLSGARA